MIKARFRALPLPLAPFPVSPIRVMSTTLYLLSRVYPLFRFPYYIDTDFSSFTRVSHTYNDTLLIIIIRLQIRVLNLTKS